MKPKFLTLMMALIFWSVSLCVAPPEGHACCPEPQGTRQSDEMLCCQDQPVVKAVSSIQESGDGGDTPIALELPQSFRWDNRVEKQNLSLYSQRFIKDQSSLYLELRVLLS